MRNLSMLTPIFFFVFLLSHISIATSTPPYLAVDNIALNCGTSRNSTARDQREWIGDIGSKFAPTEEPNHKSAISEAKSQDYIEPVPYKAARISSSQFTYVFTVNRPGPKFVRLHFYPASYSGFDNSIDFFTVKAGSFTLLTDFSASVLAKSSEEKTISKEFCINVEKDQNLDVKFIPSPSNSSKFYAFINGIEIVSMPDHLYYVQEGRAVPKYIGQDSQFPIEYKMALEMVFRLNVGGGFIPPGDDTGMFREWSQDTDYTLGGGVIPHKTNLKPIYSMIPNYTAPEDIYKSAVSMGPNRSKNMHSNLTWRLPVDSGFDFLVRLHFCEIAPQITKVSERPFIIYIDNKTAEENADVILWSGRGETPVYKDYVVRIQSNGVQDKVDYLFVALHPKYDSFAINDAILNGMEVFKLSDQDRNLAVAGPDPYNLPSPPAAQQPALTASESKSKKTIIIIAIGSGAGFLIVLTLVCCMLLWKLRKTNRYASYYPLSKCWCWPEPEPDKVKSTRTRASSLPEERCRHFSLDEIKTATHNFHEELIVGVGGFGSVYKGFIDGGTMIVAIKRLNPESKQGLGEFWTEIGMLSMLRHVHLVSLIGFCDEEGEMILVYDYMTRGTLRQHLYDTQNDPLSWEQRLNICIGTASGLNYLHTGEKQPIIHRDVKTNNILLDDKWAAKVSDFGLSKMGLDNTAISTMVKGTPGYLDPDYFKRQKLTEKSDVYSFGVVLFEVLCARKAQDQKLEAEQCHLAKWAQKCIKKGNIGEIIDPYLKGKIAPDCFKAYVEVAESCVRDLASQRPTMNDVMEKLGFALALQQSADVAKEKINPGGERSYPEVISFSVSSIIGVHSGHVLEEDSGTGFTSTDNGLTCPSLDSAITSQDVLTNTTNSKS